jgi:hypothetical protein
MIITMTDPDLLEIQILQSLSRRRNASHPKRLLRVIKVIQIIVTYLGLTNLIR